MAGTSKLRQPPRALAPKPTSGPRPSSLSSQTNTSSRPPVFDDLTAVTPVTMPNEAYRDLAQRLDSPNRNLPIEQLVDTRLCVSALTPQQCRDVLMQLDDQQIKNAVYDRTLCFPFDQWTHNIRAIYGRQVQQDTQVVSSFDNMTAHMDNLFTAWRDVVVFSPSDYANIDAHIKSYVCPSIDNIGVYGTYSGHNATKINALAALLQIGNIIIGMPILTSERGVAMFEYDALSRAVGNILSSATTDAIRRQIFSLEVEAQFLELVKAANGPGLFSGLLQAVSPGAQVYQYTVPRGDLLIPYSNQQAPLARPAPMAKKRKLSAGGRAAGQVSSDKDGAVTPGSSRASSTQPRGVTEGLVTSPSTPQNPFSRPSSASAGPVVMPPFAMAAYSTFASDTKGEDEHIKQEQSKQGEQATGQDTQNLGIAKGAAEDQPATQGAQQVTNGAQTDHEQADSSAKNDNPGPEGQLLPTDGNPSDEGTTQSQVQQAVQTEQAEQQQQQQEAGTSTEQGPKTTAYDEMLRQIEDEVFHVQPSESPEDQLKRAPAAASLIQRTASTILMQFQAAARDCDAQGRRDLFMAILQDTAFALLWILESCALNMGGTVLSAEVSRTLSRDAMVGALWGAVRLCKAPECLQLLNVTDHTGTETFAQKLERIIKQLDETGVVGFGDLRVVLANMSSGVQFPPPQRSAPAADPILK